MRAKNLDCPQLLVSLTSAPAHHACNQEVGNHDIRRNIFIESIMDNIYMDSAFKRITLKIKVEKLKLKKHLFMKIS